MSLGFEDALIDNIKEFRKLESKIPPCGFGQSRFMEYLYNHAEINAKIMDANNGIITNYLRPLLADMTMQQADHLYALSQKLFTLTENLDMGLALEIHQGIINWARNTGDIDRLVRSLYGAGIIYQQLNAYFREGGNNLFITESIECFEEAAAFGQQYFDIKSKETRMFIHRCMGNKYVTSSQGGILDAEERDKRKQQFYIHFNAAMEFWNDEKVRAHDPDMPWDAFITNAHQNMCSWLAHVRNQADGERDMVLTQHVYESFLALTKQDEAEFTSRFWSNLRTQYTSRCIAYCLGKISYEDLMADLQGFFADADTADYSADGIYAMLFVPLLLIQHIGKTRSIAGDGEVKDIINRIREYCKNLPSDRDRRIFNVHVAKFAKYMTNVLSFEEALDQILDFTTYTHLPTHVHSLMVRDLTIVMARYFIQQQPQLFIGMCKTKTTEDVKTKKEEILELISRAAICHDAGKIFYVDQVSLCSRHLYDFEFEIIKLHANADNLIKSDCDRMKFVSDVIIGHHKWYDGTLGYVEGFDNRTTDCPFVIDMISVADSIDAATDIVGRSYSKALTLEQVVEEIHQQAGTRYSPIISQALRDAYLLDKLRSCITNGREKAYFKAYQHITSK
ncbi:MAG: hypothetical protein FWE21_03615 [Defluviitaleaceae bacterium]|nr:hypothetical protein [Defluviitaleaceae bacterium]